LTALKPIGDIADVVRGVTFSKNQSINEDRVGYVPIIRAGNIQDELNLSDDLVFVPSALVTEKQILRSGDIVMCTSSGSPQIVGKSATCFSDWNGSFGAFCATIRPRKRQVSGRYLGHYLRSPAFRNWASASSGANIKNIRKSELDAFLVPLPDFEEQCRIAAVLDKADVIRRKQRAALTLQERQIQSVFVHLVGPKAEGYKSWEKKPIRELASSKKGAMRTGPFGSDLKHSEFVDDGIAVLGIDNAVKNRFAWDERRFITEEKYLKLKRYQVFPGDVVITIMGTTGRSSVVPKDIPTAITTKHLATISLDLDKAEPEFISNAIHRHPALLSQIRSQNKGAIMAGLNLGIIKELEVPMPPIEVQREFTRSLGMLRQMHSKTENALLKAEEMLASLSQRAFRGEL
jgi:type I restriction enzyme S subunit